MNHRETTPQVYAQPYADSDDPTLRGHITGGWTASDRSLVNIDGTGATTVKRVLRGPGPDHERVVLAEGEHQRLQVIMGKLAALYPGTMPGATIPEMKDSQGSVPSAAQQIHDNGLISEVPGAQRVRVERQGDVFQAPVSERAITPESSIEQPRLTADQLLTHLTSQLGQSDKDQLRFYAEALIDKKLAQQQGRGEDSIAAGQRVGQYQRGMSEAAQALASRYATLYLQIHSGK